MKKFGVIVYYEGAINYEVEAQTEDEARQIAEKIYERHTTLSKWLVSLGVDAKTAAEDACRIEHIISSESFEAIKKIAKI